MSEAQAGRQSIALQLSIVLTVGLQFTFASCLLMSKAQGQEVHQPSPGLSTSAELTQIKPVTASDGEFSVRIKKVGRGPSQVWLTAVGLLQPVQIGTIEKFKKGLRLYHWHSNSADEIKRFYPPGQIPPNFEDLKDNSDRNLKAGGGLYVSRSPTDSSRFGRSLMVVELPRDAVFMNSFGLPNEIYRRQQEINSLLEKVGIDGLSVPAEKTWFNIRSAELLTKVRVASASDIKFDELPAVDEIEALFSFLPQLKTNPHTIAVYNKVKLLMSVARSSPDELLNTVKELGPQMSPSLELDFLRTLQRLHNFPFAQELIDTLLAIKGINQYTLRDTAIDLIGEKAFLERVVENTKMSLDQYKLNFDLYRRSLSLEQQEQMKKNMTELLSSKRPHLVFKRKPISCKEVVRGE